MENPKERPSEADDAEDIPSDFFDDFSKDDFMEGLSVIDTWDEEERSNRNRRASRTKRIDVEAIDSVKDLRELIGDNNEDYGEKKSCVKFDNRYKWTKNEQQSRRSTSSSRLDDFIKPGSRRDPNKTNEAIKKDKEEKVKERLTKQLQSSDDLRPPGTELDDFFDEEKPREPKIQKTIITEERVDERPSRKSPLARQYRPSPSRRRSPRRSPRPQWTPRIPPRYSPQQRHHFRPSPNKYIRRHYSPHRRSPRRHSPSRRSPMRRNSPRRSPRRSRYSRSPQRRSNSRRSCSRSPHPRDNFLYPKKSNIHENDGPYPPGPSGSTSYEPNLSQHYVPAPGEYPGNVSAYNYPQMQAYNAGYPMQYDYTGQPVMPVPQPVSGPVVNPVAVPAINPIPAPVLDPVPPMVPAPSASSQLAPMTPIPNVETKTPYDALAQLVAEGKISQEDYMKLAPNKGASSSMDTKTRVMVLTRCSTALSKLAKLLLPNRLMMNNTIVGSEPKYLGPKYCSPLKRQAAIQFHFTKTNGSTTSQQDKQLVDSIISTLELDNIVSRSKKKPAKNMKDAAVQTTKPYCDVCEIRESMKFHEMGTSTDPEYFTSTVHTQVVEQDLVNSKSIFNPTGSVADGAPISIAHMTPAQLVSQLAARAKTLKQTEPPPPQHQFRRNPNYDYDGRGGGQYQNYNNYRY